GAAGARPPPGLHGRRVRRGGRRDGAPGRDSSGGHPRGDRPRDRGGARLRRGADPAARGVATLVTELRDAEARAASRRLLATSERELQRIVLDMHDGPVQDIFAALSQLQVLERALAGDPSSQQHVIVERQAGSLALTVSDRGRGFNPERVLAREEDVGVEGGHFGLRGIQDRVEMLGGTFALESAPGRGTSLTVTLPAE